MEPDRSRTYRPPDESGALPLSYGPVTKDAETVHQCGSVSNQENGLAIARGLVEAQKKSALLLGGRSGPGPVGAEMGPGVAVIAYGRACVAAPFPWSVATSRHT